jgi:hypothetical protein
MNRLKKILKKKRKATGNDQSRRPKCKKDTFVKKNSTIMAPVLPCRPKLFRVLSPASFCSTCLTSATLIN